LQGLWDLILVERQVESLVAAGDRDVELELIGSPSFPIRSSPIRSSRPGIRALAGDPLEFRNLVLGQLGAIKVDAEPRARHSAAPHEPDPNSNRHQPQPIGTAIS
jgi:hypothetical protein